MESLFLTVLNMSLAAVPVAALVLVLRLLLGKRLPQRFSCLLWAAVFGRLAIPAFLMADFSLFGFVTPAVITENAAALTAPRVALASQYLPLVRMDYVTPPPAALAGGTLSPLTAAAVVWLCVAAALLLFFAVFYLRVCLRLRTATRFADSALAERCARSLKMRRAPRVFVSAAVESPVVCGLFRPRVILPAALAESGGEAALRMVLAHELAHVRRRDSLVKPLMLAITCLHWFNPAAWAAFFLAVREMELACDERVLRAAGEDIRGGYAKTLFEMAVKDTPLSRFGLPAFGESAVKSRVKFILRYRKAAAWRSALSAVLLTAVMLGAFSNPALAFAPGEVPPLRGADEQSVEVWVPYSELPVALVNAVTTLEDRNFWSHDGVDWRRTTGAAVNLFVPVSETAMGGTTITQKLVRLVTRDKEISMNRKLREINRAMLMERAYSKQEILEAYLNQSDYGNEIYGVGSAALYYFGRPVNELDYAELTALAVLPAYPGAYNPIAYPEVNKERRDILLYAMEAEGQLGAAEAAAARAEEIHLLPRDEAGGRAASSNIGVGGSRPARK